MTDNAKNSHAKSGGAGPSMFYIMLGVILALLLLFLVLRPKGSQAGGSDQKKSCIEVVSPGAASPLVWL